MRVIFDLQACQTPASARRGVGRYSGALYRAFSRLDGGIDLRALIADDMPADSLPSLREHRFTRLPTFPEWGTEPGFLGGERDAIDATMYASCIGYLNADIVHVAHAFEGFSERIAMPPIRGQGVGPLVAATLYDLIPLRFPKHYFRDQVFHQWYRSRLQWLRQADLLLAISESSRTDAIDMLGIAPWRITTIHGGVSGLFKPAVDPAAERRNLAQRYGIRDRFVLYTGGDDHRKNLRGALAGYAAVAPEYRANRQFILICAMEDARRGALLQHARELGLRNDEVLITGYVPDEDLVRFYQSCDAFVFPSLYEGLGLPVLEAMACGAPVIGGDNSSIKELIAREDALFDATDPEGMARVLGSVLADPGHADALRDHALSRSREYSWDRSAHLAAAAFRDALDRGRHAALQATAHGWPVRMRMAILTPLPPVRSGIADYNAGFIPYLGRHFDIDVFVAQPPATAAGLLASFRVFDVTSFADLAGEYDVILYEFGNSEFHAHMVPLLARFPGVVGLHDAYLSGLFGYLEFYRGESGRFHAEMLHSHGPRARRLLAPAMNHPSPVEEAHNALPCTRRIIDGAIGIISHSAFNLELARQSYPEGWRAPYRIIPQMVSLPQLTTASMRTAARDKLGLPADAFVIVAFGHVVWTKWGDLLVEAVLASNLASDARVHLVFAGELAQDAFGERLAGRIRTCGMGRRVIVTGFLSEDDYQRYLHSADLAVQLRTQSRGGTPKGVLDCLAHGVPVLVNNDASYTDYPDHVVAKLPAVPTLADIGEKIEEFFADTALRRHFAEAGRAYVREHHDASACAAAYAAAIHEFVGRRRAAGRDTHVRSLAPHLARCEDLEVACARAAAQLEVAADDGFRRRRIVVDVSHIAAFDHKSGIQRVVRQIVRALYCSDRAGFEAAAVILEKGVLRSASRWLAAQELLLSHEVAAIEAPEEVHLRRGDCLLMLDSSWERWHEFAPVFREARENQVPVITAVYDLLPIRLPHCFVPGAKEWFEGWLREAIDASDAMLCISKSAAQDLCAFLDDEVAVTRRPRIGYWHLGADFSTGGAAGPGGTPTALAGQPYLLMVGTIEPRKSHQVVLDAMETLWNAGSDLCLCIAGKEGWLVAELMRRLRTHERLGIRLFLLEHADDATIESLYSGASGMIFATLGEGFGLPLVEAAHHGVPILCSDLPICREIAGEHAEYIDPNSAGTLAEQVADWWRRRQREAAVPSTGMRALTWEQSAEMMLDVVLEDRWMEEASNAVVQDH